MTTHAAVGEMIQAAGCGSTPDPNAPASSHDRRAPIWGTVPLVSNSPAHDGAPRHCGTDGSTCGGDHDVVKRGYMGKAERHHRRYFVLRAGSPSRPARLEWYETEESFRAMEKSPPAAAAAAGEEALFGCSKRR